MGSDRARVSFDELQQYRSVVMQQGRVTLEADWNEASDIASEELRKETLDIVGSSGTPDDGYKITLTNPDPNQPTPPFDFFVGPGTMYVGGVRAFLPVIDQYSRQIQQRQPNDAPRLRPAEWLDASDDPDWVDIASFANNPPVTEFVYLFLREQEVSAVEDSDLKDVALGGPDTAQRTRLIQHIVRLSTKQVSCSAALASEVGQRWAQEGLLFDGKTMRLISLSQLQVGFTQQQPQPDPCNPQAQGGYLGADNQLIRVQVCAPQPQVIPIPSINVERNALTALTGTFAWGFDDASFLYRVDVDPSNPQVLHLQSAPVDAFHHPRAGQAVEVLRSAAELNNGEFVASATGVVDTLTSPYDPDTQTITLPNPLPAEYLDPTQTPRVFLRVWEQTLPFTVGVPVALGSTGLQVTISGPSIISRIQGAIHPGDFWVFAVRPSTPQQVYPERYLTTPQPPSGPRLWACPLGVIIWGSVAGTFNQPATIVDCRQTFSPLDKLVFAEANGGAPVGPRNTLNFVGPGITVTDNPAASRIDISLGAAGATESAPTRLLFPFVTSSAGFDTGFTVANTTLPAEGHFGPPDPPSGPGQCRIYYFGTAISTQGGLQPQNFFLAAGQHVSFTLSGGGADPSGNKINPVSSFSGYVIIDCQFRGAYGFAGISTLPTGTTATPGTSFGYLAIVLPQRP
jgi:hypothetical protein